MNINLQNCVDCEELHQPHFIILNLAVGGSFTGLMTMGEITVPVPADMMVDYIRIYDNGFTELSGSGLSNEPPAIAPAHSGTWFWPAQSGHGFSMECGEAADGSPQAVIYWYTYDTMGNPVFMIGQGVPEGNRVEVKFLAPRGMIYGEFDPDSVVLEDGGSGVLEFADKENGIFSYTPSDYTSTTWGHTPIDDLLLEQLFGVPAPSTFNIARQC